jgi:hypothetical protein
MNFSQPVRERPFIVCSPILHVEVADLASSRGISLMPDSFHELEGRGQAAILGAVILREFAA